MRRLKAGVTDTCYLSAPGQKKIAVDMRFFLSPSFASRPLRVAQNRTIAREIEPFLTRFVASYVWRESEAQTAFSWLFQILPLIPGCKQTTFFGRGEPCICL
jgi:hypothetical protein